MIALSVDHPSTFHKTLVIDIETVPCVKSWNTLPEAMQLHWLKKMEHLVLSDEEKQDAAFCFENRAGIYAEFGKVICIGLGLFTSNEKKPSKIRLKALYNHDEKALLAEFSNTLKAFQKINKDLVFCGHNIKEFDIPYLCRRFIIQGLQMPEMMQFGGLKPWQVPLEDTLHLWRFGDYKHYTSLDLLASALDVPSSKTEMDGSEVAERYWKEDQIKEIADYCLQDVYTTSLVYLKLKGWQGSLPVAEKA
jgi:predicted PolB exonuclease-like 3'-5' exonuclease